MAAKLGSYLTASSGVTVIFESAIVPKFSLRDSRITFRNVYVSRGMHSDQHIEEHEEEAALTEEGALVEGGSASQPPISEQARRSPRKRSDSRVRRMSGEELADIRSRDTYEDQQRRHHANLHDDQQEKQLVLTSTEDGLPPQYTHFHFTIDSIEVALSLPRWLDGKGLVKEAKVKGVRGVIGGSWHMARLSNQRRHLTQSRFFHRPKSSKVLRSR